MYVHMYLCLSREGRGVSVPACIIESGHAYLSATDGRLLQSTMAGSTAV